MPTDSITGSETSLRPEKLSIIIPAYNEEDTILVVLRRALALELPIAKEIIVVDDGSTDRTPELLQFAERLGGFRLHCAPRNQGKGACIRTGFAMATGDILMVQDADLELDIEDVPALLAPILDGRADVVYGSRFSAGRNASWSVSYLGNRMMTGISNLLFGGGITDLHTCYKVFRREVIRRMRLTCRRFEFEPEVTAKIRRLGYGIEEVPVSYFPRTVEDGKKVRAKDGIECIYQLLKWRFAGYEELTLQPSFAPDLAPRPAFASLLTRRS